MSTKTLPHRPETSAPSPDQERHTGRIVAVCVVFVGLTVAAGAAVIPMVLGIIGLHLSAGDGATIALLAWVPSALYVAARAIGMRRRGQRDRLNSSAVVRDSL